MKRTLSVAKNELYSLFFSPIAWILMILFLILTSADYIGLLDDYTGMFERGGPALRMMENLTSKMTNGYFFDIIGNLYIFFPLITMGLISRETSSGTIKLLYSSPIKIREIVLGKFLAILCFTLCLLLLVGLTIVSFSFSVVNPDYGQIMASLFGLFLVLATYAAIGLFISSLTSYQIVAAIITLGVFALLAKIGTLWQDVDLVRNITYYMNFGGKATNFIIGLMNLRDFTYFMILIVSFIMFTIIKLKSATESISRLRKAMRYITVIVIAFIVGYITSKPQVNLYYDATRAKLYTITPPTQAILKKLDGGELDVTLYGNLLGSYYMVQPASQLRIISSVWERYIRFKPDINVHFKYYYNIDTGNYRFKTRKQEGKPRTLKQIAEDEAKSYRISLDRFMSPEEVKKYADVEAEENRNFFVLKYKGKEVILRTFDDMMYWPSENEVSAAINRLLSITPPKVAFVSGDIERGPFSERTRDYKLITSQLGNRYALINQGFDFDTLSLKQKDIPEGLGVLVLADPRAPMAPESIEKINKYIDAGGNLFVAGEPDKKEVTKPVFDKLGLSLRSGLLVQPSEKYSSDIIFSYLTDTAINISPQFARTISDNAKYSGDTLFCIAMGGASAIDYQQKDGFHVHPLLYTDKELSWNRLAPIDRDSLQLKVDSLPSDEHGSFVTAVRMNRTVNGKDQRIIVTSDADYLTGPLFSGGRPRRYNYMFGFWSFSYFSYGKFPANTLRPESIDNKMKIGVDNIPFQKLLFYWIIPALIAIACSVILIRRKRK